MGFAVLLIAIVAAAILISVALLNKAKVAQSQLKKEISAKSMLEEKLQALRREISSTKEELAKKSKMLDEARDVARKKVKKDAIRSTQEQEQESEMTDSEVDRLRRALQAMEAQLRSFQSDADRAMMKARQEAKEEFEKELVNYKEEIHKLNDQLGRRRDDAAKQKRGLAQSTPSINVETLSDDAVGEISRLLRKSEHLEKLHGITQGKLQMSQERFAEMQKRYFAVCRELALAVGKSDNVSDQEARNTAEDVIAAAETHSSIQEMHHETEDEKTANAAPHSNGVTS